MLGNLFYFISIYLYYVGSTKSADNVNIQDFIGNDVFFEITNPKELAYTYKVRPAQNFGTRFNESVFSKNIRLVMTVPPEACHYIANSEEIKGNVALVERGECNFLHKTLAVEEAGGIAIIVFDDNQYNDDIYIEMIDDNSLREVNIPAGFLLGKNGFIIKKTLVKLNRKYALINIPVNLSTKSIKELNQPPWIVW